jgi:hypothetical protein
MATGQRFLSIPRDRRHALALIALLLGLGEFAAAFFVSFWEVNPILCVLFLAGLVWTRRGGIGGPILVGLLCVFELWGFTTYSRNGIFDWLSQISIAVVSAAGLVVALAVLRQSLTMGKAKTAAARSDARTSTR